MDIAKIGGSRKDAILLTHRLDPLLRRLLVLLLVVSQRS
jgi:hypothetical protein